jgi:hypothetical protein
MTNKRQYWLQQARKTLIETIDNLRESQQLTPSDDTFDGMIDGIVGSLEDELDHIEGVKRGK